jgi:high-affinity iron transporter
VPDSLPPGTLRPDRGSRVAFYAWTLVVLAVCIAAVLLGWHAKGGTADPTDLPAGRALSHATVVINSGILVFREGLETILVLAAISASMLGANRVYRRPLAAGGMAALLATVGTWFLAIWAIGELGGTGLSVQAATGIPAIIVLLIVMNWFFHKVYWTGWIAHHNRRRRLLTGGDGPRATRRVMFGLILLGFTSVYREGFEIVIFLQNMREIYGASVVLEGVALGALFTAAVGALTFGLHQRLPYKRLLVITGVMLLGVLVVSVGEEVNEMQLAGWIGTTNIGYLHIPGWAGTWFSLFPNLETFAGQFIAIALVVGSYVAAQYLRVWRPRRRGQRAASMAAAPPARLADTPGAPGSAQLT